jgi:hypothetical protein
MSLDFQLAVIIAVIVAVVILIPVFVTDTYKMIWKGLDQECGIPKTQTGWRFLDRFKLTGQRTPGGARIIAKDIVPAFARQNLDIGLKNMLAQHNAKFPEWKSKNEIKDYTFVFVDRNFTNVETTPGSPAISRMGLHTAGTTLGLGVFPACKIPLIVLPQQFDCNWQYPDYLMHSAWYEGEHFHERFNSMPEFIQHAVVEDNHPHYFSNDVPVIPAVTE